MTSKSGFWLSLEDWEEWGEKLKEALRDDQLVRQEQRSNLVMQLVMQKLRSKSVRQELNSDFAQMLRSNLETQELRKKIKIQELRRARSFLRLFPANIVKHQLLNQSILKSEKVKSFKELREPAHVIDSYIPFRWGNSYVVGKRCGECV